MAGSRGKKKGAGLYKEMLKFWRNTRKKNKKGGAIRLSDKTKQKIFNMWKVYTKLKHMKKSKKKK